MLPELEEALGPWEGAVVDDYGDATTGEFDEYDFLQGGDGRVY